MVDTSGKFLLALLNWLGGMRNYVIHMSGEKNPDLAVEDDDGVVKVVVLQGGLGTVERGQGRAAPIVRIDKGPAIKGQVIILVTG